MKTIERVHAEFPELSELMAQTLTVLCDASRKVPVDAYGNRVMPKAVLKGLDQRGINGLQKRGLISMLVIEQAVYVPSHVLARTIL